MKEEARQNAWELLAARPRQYESGKQDGAPFGFATRVAALGLEAQQKAVEISIFALERYWLRGLALAGLLAAVTFLAGLGQMGELADLTTSAEAQLLSTGGGW